FHVVQLAGQKLTVCRQRVQQEIHGHRGRKGDVLYRGRRTLLTRRLLLTQRQKNRIDRIFTKRGEHIAVEVTWLVYQDIIDAYQHRRPSEGKKIMTQVITTLRTHVPAGLEELAELGRT